MRKSDLLALIQANDVDAIGTYIASLSDNVKEAYICELIKLIFNNAKHTLLPVVYNEIAEVNKYINIKTYIADLLDYFPDEFNLTANEQRYYAASYGSTKLFHNTIKFYEDTIQEELITLICKNKDVEKYKVLLKHSNELSTLNSTNLIDNTLSAISDKVDPDRAAIFYALFNYLDLTKVSEAHINDLIVYLRLYGIEYTHIIKLVSVTKDLSALHGEVSDTILINLAANGYDIVKLKLVNDYSVVNNMNSTIVDNTGCCKDVVKVIMSY